MGNNQLINSLDSKDQRIFFSNATLTKLSLSEIIYEFDKPTEYLYFPTDGFFSIIQAIDFHTQLEVGMIGREGFLGAEVMLGLKNNPFKALVQGEGHAWKIKPHYFLAQIKKNQRLAKITLGYLAIRFKLLSLSCACEHFHAIGPRLAKWLLMSQDRAQSSTFMMTHESIGLMMGVRRVGITTAANDFRKLGLINYHRGEMQILNRTALMKQACSCYQKNNDIFGSLLIQLRH
jgi:CRP-like cAMP-binding protein